MKGIMRSMTRVLPIALLVALGAVLLARCRGGRGGDTALGGHVLLAGDIPAQRVGGHGVRHPLYE